MTRVFHEVFAVVAIVFFFKAITKFPKILWLARLADWLLFRDNWIFSKVIAASYKMKSTSFALLIRTYAINFLQFRIMHNWWLICKKN